MQADAFREYHQCSLGLTHLQVLFSQYSLALND
jgi:hypothetical protein